MSKQKSKTVYFVRHGQSVDNVSPVFQSVASPLSDKGKQQARALAERLTHVEFDTLIASPILRAKQTAEQIAQTTGQDIVFSKLFQERIKPNSVDGKSWEDAEAQKIWRTWEETLYAHGEPNARVEDGENYHDLIKRADAALQFLLARPEQKLVVVTHGYFLRCMIAHALFGDQLTGQIMKQFQERAKTENTGITVLQYQDAFEEAYNWRLWTFNDHSHFAE